MNRAALFAPARLAFALGLVFLGTTTTPVPEEAAWLGGLVPTLMQDLSGQWWRLLTAALLHVRPGHLLLNLFTLVWTGAVVARLLGRDVMHTLWWTGALCASLASLAFTTTWSLGASGANAALLGGLLGLAARRWRRLDPAERRLLALGVSPGLLGLALFGTLGPTDHAAHFAGLATGLVMGVTLPWLPVRVLASGCEAERASPQGQLPQPKDEATHRIHSLFRLRKLSPLCTLAATISLVFGMFHAMRDPPDTWPPARWVTVQGPAPCVTAYTNGIAFTCTLPAAALPTPPPPPPFRRFDFEGPGGQARVLFAPDTPRTHALLQALAVAPEAGYTHPP